MSASVSPFDTTTAARLVPHSARASSILRVAFARAGAATEIASLFETGGLRMRCPKADGGCEGVLINTGGGIAGGDRVAITCDLGARSRATVTTQSAEKIYRAESIPAQLAVSLNLGSKSNFSWLPQETLLFDGARLSRTFDAALAPDASLTILETVVFGRLARGERLGVGLLRDRWRIRRDGHLIFADDVHLDGAIADRLDRPACGGGARAIATLLHISPKAESRLRGMRAVLGKARSTCGASAFNATLIARFASPDPAVLRADVARAAQFIQRGALPRVWSC